MEKLQLCGKSLLPSLGVRQSLLNALPRPTSSPPINEVQAPRLVGLNVKAGCWLKPDLTTS